MRLVLLVLFALVVVGCSGTDELGKIGNTTFHSVHGDHFWGPNFTAMVVENNGEAGVVKVGFGPGAGHAIVGGFTKVAADVGASAVQWHGYKPNTYSGDSVSVSGTSDSDSGASSGSVSGAVAGASATQAQGQVQGQAQAQVQSKPGKPDKPEPKDCKPEPKDCEPKKPKCDDRDD